MMTTDPIEQQQGKALDPIELVKPCVTLCPGLCMELDTDLWDVLEKIRHNLNTVFAGTTKAQMGGRSLRFTVGIKI